MMELFEVLQENVKLRHLHVQCCYFSIQDKKCIYFDKLVNPNGVGCELWNGCKKCVRRSYIDVA